MVDIERGKLETALRMARRKVALRSAQEQRRNFRKVVGRNPCCLGAAFEFAQQRIGPAAEAAADFQNGGFAGWQRPCRGNRADLVADGVNRIVIGKIFHPRDDAFRSEQGLFARNLSAQDGGVMRCSQRRNGKGRQAARIVRLLALQDLVRIEDGHGRRCAITAIAVRRDPYIYPFA